MEKKGNTYYFTPLEKRIIKSMVDKRYGKETTPADYDSTGGDYDMGVEGDIKNKTGENVSGSTMERLVGLREKEMKGVSPSTLKIVAEYLGFDGYEKLLNYIEYSLVHKTGNALSFDIADVFRQHSIRLSFNEDKVLVIKYHNANSFEVLSCVNLKLLAGDKLEVSQLNAGEEMICTRIIRQYKKNKSISLGKYKTGANNPVRSIELFRE